MNPFIRTGYNYDTDAVSNETGLLCADPTRTKQEFKEESDINTIVERFGIGYELPQDIPFVQNADFDGVFNFQDAMNTIIAGERAFSVLHADTRARFNNDAARFVDFCSDPANQDEMVKMGLAVRRPEPVKVEPLEVRVVGQAQLPT